MIGKVKIVKHPAAIARDQFVERNKDLFDGAPTGQYLRNRLEAAFMEGWDARDRHNPKKERKR